MRLLHKTAFAALLLGSTIAAPVLAATPDSTGCPPGLHRADSEGSGVGSVNYAGAAQKADSEGSGVGSVNYAGAAQKADSEGSGVGSVSYAGAAQKAAAEGGSGTVQTAATAAPCR
jgi:hypothetical protein